MSLRRQSARKATAILGALRNDLAKELTNPGRFGQPMVLESETPRTNMLRVDVIWDRWNECPRESRQQVIMDAYADAHRPEAITLALGLTVPEAVGIGLLPYQIVLAKSQEARIRDADCRKAMIEMGASTLFGVDEPQLRVAMYDDADAALQHLESALPGSKWILIREVPEGSASTSMVTSHSFSLPLED